jgi:hypothetical protein
MRIYKKCKSSSDIEEYIRDVDPSFKYVGYIPWSDWLYLIFETK